MAVIPDFNEATFVPGESTTAYEIAKSDSERSPLIMKFFSQILHERFTQHSDSKEIELSRGKFNAKILF